MFRFTAVVIILGAAASVAFAQVPNLPDLDVTYIQRVPRNVGVAFEYPNDIPKPGCTCLSQPEPGRGPFTYKPQPKPTSKPVEEMTVQQMLQACRHWPTAGQQVTFIAHIKNHGGAPAPPAPYVFLIDDKPVSQGSLPEVAPGAEATASCKWKWQDGDHTVEFRLTPQSAEICSANDRRADRTNAVSLTIQAYTQEVYDAFANAPNMLGSYSFEDWCQAHIDKWNENLAAAVYPATPKGVTERIRFDGIFAPDSPDLAKRLAEGEGINWRIDWKIDDVPRYATGIDWGLIHELCHQCGIIDLYAMGLGQVNNLARRADGKYVFIGHSHGQWCLMGGGSRDPRTCFSEHTAAGFEAMKGWPRGGYGLYLFDIPQHNIVRLLDNRGKPLAEAEVRLFQQDTESIIGRIAPLRYTTDDDGEIDLGDFPFAKLHVVGWTGILMLEIKANGQTEYHFLDVTQMNIAYWRGDKRTHTFTMKTGIAPPDSAAAPSGLEAKLASERKVRLSWHADKDPKAFRVLRSESQMDCSLEPPLAQIAELPGTAREAEVELTRAAPSSFFTVTAVDDQGNESAYANVVRAPDYELIPFLVRPWGVALGPDGTAYTIDNHMGILFSISRSGRPTNWRGKVELGSGDPVGLAISPDASTLYIVGQASHAIYVADLVKEKQIVRSFGGGDLKQPWGVAVSQDGTAFVADRLLGEVVIFDATGTKIGSITGFNNPLAVAWDDERRLLCVADSGNNRLQMYTLAGGEPSLPMPIEGVPNTQSVSFGPGGRIYVGDLRGGNGLTILDADGSVIGRWLQKPFAFHDGTILFGLAVGYDGTAYLTQGGNERWFLKVTPDEVQWQPSGGS